LTAYPLTAFVTLLVCLLMLAVGINVGRARSRYNIKAPAVTGHELFERAYRIQMNTLETAVMMLPALWVNAAFISDRGAAALGAVWVIARIWYAVAYQLEPPKRGPAFGLSMLAMGLLLGVALFGVGRVLLH
jgi:glutathione S-transferase